MNDEISVLFSYSTYTNFHLLPPLTHFNSYLEIESAGQGQTKQEAHARATQAPNKLVVVVVIVRGGVDKQVNK